MRIHEVEIYSSKQILAFIEYLKVLADEKKAIEDMQSHYANPCNGMIGSQIGWNQAGLGAAQATPEYMAKLRAEAAAQQAAEKVEAN